MSLDTINHLFETYNVNFRDVNYFCEEMVNLRAVVRSSKFQSLSVASQIQHQGGVDELWRKLEMISMDRYHRHRTDAANIIAEVQAREAGDQESVLIPDPQPTIPYAGLPRTTPYVPQPWEEITIANILGRTPIKKPDDPLPVPWVKVPMQFSTPAPLLPENTELFNYIPAAAELAAVDGRRNLILNDLSQGTLDPLSLPFKYLDDPDEIVLDMPENLRFILDPIPDVNPTLLDSTLWPELQIYDYRGLYFGSLEQDHYIYQLFSWARLTMAQPQFARNYCIIFRGHPSLYQLDTPEQLEDEDPPTLQELECMIQFITKTMPTICIYKRDPSTRDGRSLGFHDRVSLEHTVNINGGFFDAIEDAVRDGANPSHILYTVYVTFVHECAHYYNTLIHNGTLSFHFDTPRRLRFLVAVNPEAEEVNSPDYNPWFFRRGEMGELVEWLVFGYYLDVPVTGKHDHLLGVVGWGSYPAQGSAMVRIGSIIAEALIRTPVRLTIHDLRLYIQEVLAQRTPSPMFSVHSGSSPLILPTSGFTGPASFFGPFAAANPAPPAPFDANYGMGPAPATGAGGYFLDLFLQAAEQAANSPPPISPPPMSMDICERAGAITRLKQIVDVDEEFVGYRIGTNDTYRRALWRVTYELNQATAVREGREPIGDIKSLNPSTLKEVFNSRKPIWVSRRPAECERYVPKKLPQVLGAWKLLVSVGLAYWILWLASFRVDRWRSSNVRRDDNYYYVWVLFPLAAMSLFVYLIPYRVLFKLFGTHRVPKTYSTW